MDYSNYFKNYQESITFLLKNVDIKLINKSVNLIKKIKENNQIIYIVGNGGSASIASHVCVDFTKAAGITSVSFNNSNLITCYANDYGYDQVFNRELEALGKKNDVLIAISTSGNSPNVVQAVKTANSIGMKVHCLTGMPGGILNKLCNCLKIPSNSTDKIQECHIMIGHIICCLVEKNFFDKENISSIILSQLSS